MPNTKKSAPNVVSTVSGGASYRVTKNGLVQGVGSYNSYVATKQEILYILTQLFTVGAAHVPVVVYYKNGGRNSGFVAGKNMYGGFSIGCQTFNRQQTRKFAALVGMPASKINRFIPALARAAAAAGR